jgi:hypothetical protein
MRSDKDLVSLVSKLDGTGSESEWAAVDELRRNLGADFPKLLLTRYIEVRSWQCHASCVYHALKYAKESDAAVELGRLAIKDKRRSFGTAQLR